MKNLVKKIFCKHEYKTTTNLYGDAINYFNGARSLKKCINCGKIIKGNFDNNCREINNF